MYTYGQCQNCDKGILSTVLLKINHDASHRIEWGTAWLSVHRRLVPVDGEPRGRPSDWEREKEKEIQIKFCHFLSVFAPATNLKLGRTSLCSLIKIEWDAARKLQPDDRDEDVFCARDYLYLPEPRVCWLANAYNCVLLDDEMKWISDCEERSRSSSNEFGSIASGCNLLILLNSPQSLSINFRAPVELLCVRKFTFISRTADRAKFNENKTTLLRPRKSAD